MTVGRDSLMQDPCELYCSIVVELIETALDLYILPEDPIIELKLGFFIELP